MCKVETAMHANITVDVNYQTTNPETPNLEPQSLSAPNSGPLTLDPHPAPQILTPETHTLNSHP